MILYTQTLVIILAILSIVYAQSTNTTGSTTPTTYTTTAVPTSISNISMSSTIDPNATDTSSIVSSTLSSSRSIYTLPLPSASNTGWDPQENPKYQDDQSWLRQNNRFVFVIFLGLILLALIIWYITKSVKGMRKRLERENQEHLYMMQQASSNHPDRVIEPTQTLPPPAYKADTYTSLSDNTNHTRY